MCSPGKSKGRGAMVTVEMSVSGPKGAGLYQTKQPRLLVSASESVPQGHRVCANGYSREGQQDATLSLRTPDSLEASHSDTEVLQSLPRIPRPAGPDSPEFQLDPPSIQQDGGRLIVDSWKEAEGSCRRHMGKGPPGPTVPGPRAVPPPPGAFPWLQTSNPSRPPQCRPESACWVLTAAGRREEARLRADLLRLGPDIDLPEAKGVCVLGSL